MAKRSAPAQPDLARRLDLWRDELAGWAIPEHILAQSDDSPWVLPRQVFARRADRMAAQPDGASFRRAWGALDPPGSVLDVGSGAGAACIPLLPRTTALTAVDADQQMLDLPAGTSPNRFRRFQRREKCVREKRVMRDLLNR